MELNVLRSAATVMSFLVFVGIVVWAWNGRNRADFDEASQLPFADDDRAETPGK
ncbi:cbb3-type cytochrome oxidase subunit 3 [Derxia lacustris]|uniref:cbb3-type cytochrome oxidase subunit 3 n=1 Tax=Derxia lacustris TaxID=764842 RepID=UPI000A170D30|nr:cbb3-type cytochrome c oxidase subunit 3 [Derxia lacustris]